MNNPKNDQQTRLAHPLPEGVSDTFVRPCLGCGITIHVVDGRERDHLHHVFEADESRAAYAWWQGYEAGKDPSSAAHLAHPSPRASAPNVPSVQVARRDRYAEALWGAADEAIRDAHVPEEFADQARAVLAVADSELAGLRAERDDFERAWERSEEESAKLRASNDRWRARVARIEDLARLGTAAVRREEELREGIEARHWPWYEVNGIRHDHTVMVYGADVPKGHVCRVDGNDYDRCVIDPEFPEDGEHVVLACYECRCPTDDGDPGYLLWPCATAALLASSPAATTGEAAADRLERALDAQVALLSTPDNWQARAEAAERELCVRERARRTLRRSSTTCCMT